MLTLTGTPWSQAVVLAAVFLSGCAGVLPQPPQPPPRTYLLAPDLEGLHSVSRGRRSVDLDGLGPTLSVSRPENASGCASARMAYMEQDFQLDYYADHAWVDSPATMLGPLLAEALRASGDFAAVTEEARGIHTDLRLDTLIVDLYQDFRTRPSLARMELRVRLVDPERRRILGSQVFADAEPVPSDDAYGGVVGANRVLARMLPRIAEFAAEAAARAGPSEKVSAPAP